SSLAPPRSTRAISSARRAKSADRIDGTISIICGLLRFYHSGEEAIPFLAPRQAEHPGTGNFFVFFRFQRAGRVDQDAARGEYLTGICQQRLLSALEIGEILGAELPLDLGIPAE